MFILFPEELQCNVNHNFDGRAAYGFLDSNWRNAQILMAISLGSKSLRRVPMKPGTERNQLGRVPVLIVLFL